MARKPFTEQTQRGCAHAVLGMPACQSGRSLVKSQPACADCACGDTPHPGADYGNPGMSW